LPRPGWAVRSPAATAAVLVRGKPPAGRIACGWQNLGGALVPGMAGYGR